MTRLLWARFGVDSECLMSEAISQSGAIERREESTSSEIMISSLLDRR